MESFIETFKKLQQTDFKELREWQGYCLSKYEKIEDQVRIIGLKAPTGTGKTLVGLIIANKSLNDDKTVLYITWTDAFMEKVEETTQQLGIPAVTFGGKGKTQAEKNERASKILAYRRKKAVGITNFATFLKSQIPLPDILIIDDADLFLESLIDFFTIKIPRRTDPNLYTEILGCLDPNVYDGIEELQNRAERTSEQILIYFSEQLKIIDIIKQWINKLIKESKITAGSEDREVRDLFFSWIRNKDHLTGNLIHLENNYIILQPYLPPSNSIANFTQSQRILLMSATLGNERRFAWELGLPTEEISIIDEEILISEGTSPDKIHMGARAIFPITNIDTKEINNIIKAIVKASDLFEKILVLCHSRKERDSLVNLTSVFADLSDFAVISYSKQEEIQEFIDSEKALLVVGGQYFGLDIPDNVCNCVIITQIPYISDPRDKLEAQIIGNQEYHYERTARKITQAFGRINRDFNDIGVFFVLDYRYHEELSTGLTWSKFLPPIIIAETLFTHDKTKHNTMEEALEISKKFLNEEYPSYLSDRKRLIKEAKSLVKEVDLGYYSGFSNEIKAWNYFYQEAYDDAEEEFNKCTDLIKENTQNFQDRSVQNRKAFNLYLAAKSLYILQHRGGDPEYFTECQDLIRRAKASSTIPWFQRLERLNIYSTSTLEGTPESIHEDFFENLGEYFTPVVWNHPAFTDDLKIQYQKAFSAIKIDATEMAGERVHTLIERVFRKIVEYLELDLLDDSDDLSKLSISQILQVLRENFASNKSTLTYWYDESESPGHLRSRIVHQKYDTKTLQEFNEAIYWLKRGFIKIFLDIRFYSFLEKNLTPDAVSSLNALGKDYKRLSYLTKYNEILNRWANEKLKFFDTDKTEDGSVITTKCTIQHKGHEVTLILG